MKTKTTKTTPPKSPRAPRKASGKTTPTRAPAAKGGTSTDARSPDETIRETLRGKVFHEALTVYVLERLPENAREKARETFAQLSPPSHLNALVGHYIEEYGPRQMPLFGFTADEVEEAMTGDSGLAAALGDWLDRDSKAAELFVDKLLFNWMYEHAPDSHKARVDLYVSAYTHQHGNPVGAAGDFLKAALANMLKTPEERGEPRPIQVVTPDDATAESIAVGVLLKKLGPYLRSDKAQHLGKLAREPDALWPFLARLVPSPVPEATRPPLMNDMDAEQFGPLVLKRLTEVATQLGQGPGEPLRIAFNARVALVDKATRNVEVFTVHKQEPGMVTLDLRKSEEWLNLRGELTLQSVVAKLAGYPRPE